MTPKEMLERALGIGKAPAPPEPERKPEWYELAIELGRRHKEFERQRDAREQAEREAAIAPQTAAGILRGAISESVGSSGHIPLNGERVLRAALAGGNGTINGRDE